MVGSDLIDTDMPSSPMPAITNDFFRTLNVACPNPSTTSSTSGSSPVMRLSSSRRRCPSGLWSCSWCMEDNVCPRRFRGQCSKCQNGLATKDPKAVEGHEAEARPHSTRTAYRIRQTPGDIFFNPGESTFATNPDATRQTPEPSSCSSCALGAPRGKSVSSLGGPTTPTGHTRPRPGVAAIRRGRRRA